MEWQATLGGMARHGALLRRMCSDGCAFWRDEDVGELLAVLGPDATLIDARPPCPVCDRRNHFSASPGSGSPFRPLLSRDRGPEPKRPPGGWEPWP